MKSISVTVSERGYIILPAHLRKEMAINPGTRILISEDKGKLILETVPSFTKKLSGLTEKTIAKTPKQVTQFIDAERENKKS